MDLAITIDRKGHTIWPVPKPSVPLLCSAQSQQDRILAFKYVGLNSFHVHFSSGILSSSDERFSLVHSKMDVSQKLPCINAI